MTTNENRVSEAFKELTEKLNERATLIDSHVEEDGVTVAVKRSHYIKALKEVEEKYKIEQGDPDYLKWFLTLIGRSPKIIEDEAQPEFKNFIMGKPYEEDSE